MRVIWSVEAAEQLREITNYVAERNPQAARRIAAALLKRSRHLAQPPLTGRRLPEFPHADLRELLERPYRLIYRITDSRVEIVALKHYRQLLPLTGLNDVNMPSV